MPPDPSSIVCPVSTADAEVITLGHGGGGGLTRSLIEGMFLPAFADPALEARLDAGMVDLGDARLAFTTDTYVVSPPFFAGGDIGMLAVHGTVNDLAACAARPLFMSVGLILEEGFPMSSLRRVVESLAREAAAVGMRIVAGDTKVVERGKGDGIFVSASGIGLVQVDPRPGPDRIEEGDAILVSGDIGRHGVAVLATREGLAFETEIESDTAPLWDLVRALLDAGIELRCMRDPTRGGAATALVEIAEMAQCTIELDEPAVPVEPQVQGACELLGLDPLYVACEGRMLFVIPPGQASAALAGIRSHPLGRSGAVIGRVGERGTARVLMRSSIGSTRIIDLLSGEQLPRIC